MADRAWFAKSPSQFRKDLRGRRRDEQQVGVVRQLDVTGLPADFLVEQIRHHRLPRERLQGQRRDEVLRLGGHHGAHLASAPGELAGDVGSLVRGDGTGDAQDDGSSLSSRVVLSSKRQLTEPPAQIPLGLHDRAKFGEIFFH